MNENGYFKKTAKLFNSERINEAPEALKEIRIPFKRTELLRIAKEEQVSMSDINNNKNSKEEFSWT